MDDAFIGTPREHILVPITGAEPHSERNGVPRRAPKRRVQAARPTQRFGAVDLHATVENMDFDIVATPDDSVITRLAGDQIGVGCDLALELLDRRIAGGDTELLAVKCVVERCLSLISAMPPLSHVDSVPLRPDDRLYEFFDQFLSLLRRQESQMQALQTIINELI
jgi:hypothetical protein